MKSRAQLGVASLDTTGSIDRATLAGLRHLGPRDFRELVLMFLDDSKERVTQLLADREKGDSHAIAAETHTLKGSSASFGAKRLVELCTQIEAALAATEQPGVRQLLYQVAIEFERTRAALTKELQ